MKEKEKEKRQREKNMRGRGRGRERNKRKKEKGRKKTNPISKFETTRWASPGQPVRQARTLAPCCPLSAKTGDALSACRCGLFLALAHTFESSEGRAGAVVQVCDPSTLGG